MKVTYRAHAVRRMFERSVSTDDETIVVTVYEPAAADWEPDFRRKKR